MRRHVSITIWTFLSIGFAPGSLQAQDKDDKALTQEEVAAAWSAVKQHGCLTVGYFDDVDDPDRKLVEFPSAALRTHRRFALGFPDKTTNADLARLAVSLSRLPGLTSIDLGSCAISNAGVKAIRNVAHLEAIFLDGTAVGDGIAAELANFKKLRWLDLSRTKLTDKGSSELDALARLETLLLANNGGITDAGIQGLGKLARLQSLSIAGTKVMLAEAATMKGVEALTRLDISRTPIGDDGLAFLSGLTCLEELNARETQVTGSGCAKLSGLASLHTLRLTDSPITDDGAKGIGDLKQIRTLHLDGPLVLPKDKTVRIQISDAGLAEVARCQSLRRLSLARTTTIRGEGLRELAKLPNLIELNLDGSAIQPRALPEVSETKSLRVLGLARTQLTGDGLKTLTTLKDLRSLDLEGSKLNDAGMSDIAFLRTVSDLNLRDTIVSSAGVAHLSGLSLVRIDLSKTRIDAGIVKHLNGMKSLKTVVLTESGFPEGSIATLQRALPRCTIVGPAAKNQPATASTGALPRLPVD
jgi:internalin A